MNHNDNLAVDLVAVYWMLMRHGDWALPVAATNKGLCYVGGNGESIVNVQKRFAARFSQTEWIYSSDKLSPYCIELADYLDGKRISFTIPCDAVGTPFQQMVWNALLDIPYGTTVTYASIATTIGMPSAVRAVGAAIGANPILITVPCHRVVAKTGALTGYRGGLTMKSKLLELEQTYRFEHQELVGNRQKRYHY